MPRPLSKKVLFLLVYLVSFLYSFHYALPLYIDSSFLAQFLPTEATVGIVFSVSSLFSAIVIFLYPRILRRWGNYKATVATMGLEVSSLIALAVFSKIFPNAIAIVLIFIIHQILVNTIYLNLDTFVESFSKDSEKGGIRGIFMNILSIAVAVADSLLAVPCAVAVARPAVGARRRSHRGTARRRPRRAVWSGA